MANAALMRKLRLRPGERIAITNAPQDYMEALGELPDDVSVEEVPMKGLDFVHLFVRDVAQLQRYGPIAVEAVRYDGVLWISYPKKSSGIQTDISSDRGWDVITRAGLRPVGQISIDETWSALNSGRLGKLEDDVRSRPLRGRTFAGSSGGGPNGRCDGKGSGEKWL